MNLDETDRKILNKLQIDGRITNQDLAKHCNLSPSACFDRTRKLRDNGYISSYVALLDPHLNQRPLLIFIEVLLNRTTGDIFRQFAEATRRQRDILECHMVAGGFDYLIKVRMKDMAAYRKFLAEELVDMPGVRETRTYAVLEEVKSTVQLPL